MRLPLPNRRSSLLAVLMLAGLVNASLIIRPWARDAVTATDIATAAAAAPKEQATPSTQSLISLGKTQLLSADEAKRLKTGVLFMSYFLMSTRAFSARCAELGVDASAAATAFARSHTSQYDKASDVIGENGLNADLVWTFYSGQLAELAGRHIEQYAQHDRIEAAEVCRTLAKAPDRFVERRDFARLYPTLNAELMSD